MHIYTVHVKRDKQPKQLINDALFLKEGFTWMGFIFNIFWLLAHRIYWQSAVLLGCILTLALLQDQGIISEEVAVILDYGMMILIGFEGQDWHRHKLQSKGYSCIGIVAARDDIEAQQRFFDRYNFSASAVAFTERNIA